MKKIIVLIITVAMLLCLTACEEPVIETRSIKSCVLTANESTSSSGTFVLGVGVYTQDEKLVTEYYLYVYGDEGYRLQEIKSTRLEISETDTIDPCIKGEFWGSGRIKSNTDYVIYVPVGTITEEYKAKIGE